MLWTTSHDNDEKWFEDCAAVLGEVHDESVYGAIERLIQAGEQAGFVVPDLIRMLKGGMSLEALLDSSRSGCLFQSRVRKVGEVQMPTLLCLDDFTYGLSGAVQWLRENGYQVLAADDNAAALKLAASTPLDAIILNCHHDKDNSELVMALRVLQPDVAVVMFSGYCGVPCHQLHLADVCIQKGESLATLLALLQSVRCQSKYGFCRSIAV